MIMDRREFTVHQPTDVMAIVVQALHQPRQLIMTTRGVRRDVKIEVTDFGDTDFVIRRLPVRPLALFNRGRVEGKLQRLTSTHTLVTLSIDHRLTALRAAINFAACVLMGLMGGWLFASSLLVGISVFMGISYGVGWYI